jgi:hypothetical protein
MLLLEAQQGLKVTEGRVADPEQLERVAEAENTQGHRISFAAQQYSVSGDIQESQDGLIAAAQHYERSGLAYLQAAEARIQLAEAAQTDAASSARAHASADYGYAASVYWYAGRSYADAYNFEHAAQAMESAAGAYVSQAVIREQDGRSQTASTLRVEATFRFLDAQRYYQQASDFRRNLATNLAAVGEDEAAGHERAQSDDLQRRAVAAGASVNQHGPEYHASYQSAYKGANKSSYK